jgi:hypothetical protein
MNIATVQIAARHDIFESLTEAISTWKPLEPALFRGIDWQKFLAASEHHAVLPLVITRLLERADLEIDPEISATLRSRMNSSLSRSFLFAQELLRVVVAFREAGLRIMPYKGPALAEELWGSFSVRECSDLDFLIPPDDVPRAGAVLEALGYLRVSPVKEQLRPFVLRNASEEQFRHVNTNILLELQWSPAPRVLASRFDIHLLWERARYVAFAGEQILSPSPEDLLLLLCIHGWKHNWSRLIWVADVAQLLRHFSLDWKYILDQAERNRSVRLLSLGLHMSHLCFGSLLPNEITVDQRICRLAALLRKRLRDGKPHSYLEWHQFMLAARDSTRDQLLQVVRFILTPGLGEYAAVDLPPWAFPMFRVVRLARVLRMMPGKTQEQ